MGARDKVRKPLNNDRSAGLRARHPDRRPASMTSVGPLPRRGPSQSSGVA